MDASLYRSCYHHGYREIKEDKGDRKFRLCEEKLRFSSIAMLATKYKRRYREYNGPSPNSVAIREKPTRRRPPEHLILERRKQDELINEANIETNFLTNCDLKSAWVKATNKRIERNTLRRRLQQELKKEEVLLEDRREKLRELLYNEEQKYIEEMENTQETTLERQAKMRERAKQLKERRENERKQYVAEKLDQRWRDGCEELRVIKTKENQDNICIERNEQILLKEESKKREEEYDKMYAELWKNDCVAKSKREEEAAKNQIERNRESLKVLQLQIATNEDKIVQERKVKEMEAEWLKEETKLRKEEEQWTAQEKLRKQEHARRVRDASIKLKQKKLAKEKAEEEALENEILKKLVEDTNYQNEEETRRKAELREENLRFMAYMGETRRNEADRERNLEDMIHHEVEEQWQKKAAKYKLEREARKKLMANVMQNRQQQIYKKKEKEEQLKVQAEQEKNELLAAMTEHKRLEEESAANLKQRNLGYQNDLEMQMKYQEKMKNKEKQDVFQEFLAGKNAEADYQRKLQEALSRPQSEKLHPSRKRLIHRHNLSAH